MARSLIFDVLSIDPDRSSPQICRMEITIVTPTRSSYGICTLRLFCASEDDTVLPIWACNERWWWSTSTHNQPATESNIYLTALWCIVHFVAVLTLNVLPTQILKVSNEYGMDLLHEHWFDGLSGGCALFKYIALSLTYFPLSECNQSEFPKISYFQLAFWSSFPSPLDTVDAACKHVCWRQRF